MRNFAIGLGIGTFLCLVAVTLLVTSLNRLEDNHEVPTNLLQTDREALDGEHYGAEYGVIVKIKLSDDAMGTEVDLEAAWGLEDQLLAKFEHNPELGEFDGDGFGFGYFDLYMYTSDPELLVEQILPIVREANPPTGSHIITYVTESGADEKRFEI